MKKAHVKWMHDLAFELLIVLARDRFGDFVSDQVMAPVRETTAMALGNLMKLMQPKQLENVLSSILELTNMCKYKFYTKFLKIYGQNHNFLISILYS